EGFRQAITLDGDSQHDPADIPRFLAAGTCFSDALILGARNMSHPNVPWTSRVGNRIANFFVNLSARQWLPDTQCGFRLYPLGPIDRLPLKGPGYEFESEVIVRAARIGMRFHTIPISIRYPGGQGRTTHFNLHRDTWRVFRCILRSFLWR
ncbi:MAG: glycosyltransferase family 2 protein, partial [Deltaproteobacteria bacterium]